MNNKRWSFIAIILIALGIAGMAYQQFDFSNNEELPYHQQKWSFDSLTSLNVNSDYNVDVKFINSSDNSNYVEVSGNMKQETIDQLKNTVAAGDSFTLNLTEKQSWSFFSFNFHSTKQQITVALSKPEQLDQLKFKLTSNDGSFTDLVGKTIEVSTSSGNIVVENAKTNQLTLNATSGNITAKKIAGDTEINLTSGNTKVDELTGALIVESTSGEISIDHVNGPVKTSITSGNTKINNLTGPGEFKSTSGNITLSDQRSDSLDISNQSGNVKLSIDDSFKGIYDLKSTSGNIKAPDSPMKNSDLIKIRVTSGNISIE
ncbi:Putative adhesin [Fontibacillus panacisegetis]|uniref:Putative adhesin n=1 Tax=Fontibacillus panacisegetis TaxID=670482 RepID=A0A1G7U6H6_9BACL|nr:DUF4097 family beta strand repeat-containing protein [Fontibacillus panacisegetis]SDG42871.1 Putative adhesin [Fontibacillus panacisegetis]